MGREVNIEKEFSENVDLMLAGEEVKVGVAINDDCRTALDFVQKIVRLRAVPSPSFNAELKEKLLRQLSEQETGIPVVAKKNWFWEGLRHLVPRSMVLRAVTTTALVIILAVVGVFWYMGGFTQPPAPAPAPVPAPTPAPTLAPAPRPPQLSLELGAVPAQATYLPGETVEIEFSFTNVISEPITVSPFPPEIQIMLPRPHEVVRSFAAGTQELELEPSKTATYNLTWDQRDNSGQQVAPGWYYVDVKDITISKAIEPTISHMSAGTIAKLLIQYPQGAMEKVIEVNQSQTVMDLPFMWKREEYSVDLTIILERVELTADGARFLAFATSPNSPSTGYDHPQWSGCVRAQYTVDGVIKDAGPAGMRYLTNGIRLSWGYDVARLDPVPSDAKELVFTITSFGDWEGPWEFSIPLEP